MIRAVRPLAGAACMFLAAACGVVPTAPPVSPSDLANSPQVLLGRLAGDESRLTSVRGLATVLYQGAAGSGSALQAIVVAPPDRARLETLSPIGTTLLVLTIRGDDLRVHSLIRHEYGEGRATRETLGRLTKVPLPPEPLVRLLAGLPPLPLRLDDPRVRTSRGGADTVQVDSVDGAFWQQLWTGPDGFVDHGALGDTTGPLLRFQFADRQALAETSFPFEIRLEETTASTTLVIRYQKVRLNLPVEADVFELPRPADGQTRILDLEGGPRP
jgi:hypothetical protein